jgi:transposase-like protein
MRPISYARHQFPSGLVRHPIWLYRRLTLSYCDVEELLAERELSCLVAERCWDRVRWVIEAYAWRFDGSRQPAQARRRS